MQKLDKEIEQALSKSLTAKGPWAASVSLRDPSLLDFPRATVGVSKFCLIYIQSVEIAYDCIGGHPSLCQALLSRF